MDELLNFLIEVGKLKRMPRRGWVINQIKNGETIAEHIFRAAIMAWVLGKDKKDGFKMEKLIKIALVHDLCEVYAGDITPYDSILPKSKKMIKELMKTWPRLTALDKKKIGSNKYKKEIKSLDKLIAKLPLSLKKELRNLWMDYEKGLTPEGRFFRQTDRMENFLQAYEYWNKFKNPPLAPWWLWAREFFDEPILIKFMDALERKFHPSSFRERKTKMKMRDKVFHRLRKFKK